MKKIVMFIAMLMLLAVPAQSVAQPVPTGFKRAWEWGVYRQSLADAQAGGDTIVQWAAVCNASGYYTPNQYPCAYYAKFSDGYVDDSGTMLIKDGVGPAPDPDGIFKVWTDGSCPGCAFGGAEGTRGQLCGPYAQSSWPRQMVGSYQVSGTSSTKYYVDMECT